MRKVEDDGLAAVAAVIPQAKQPSMQHTPGPWIALCLRQYTRVVRRDQGPDDETGSVQICHIAGPEDADLRPTSGASWEANARLIAAAPTLLAALKHQLERHIAMINSGDCGNWDPDGDGDVIAMRAAINSAESERPEGPYVGNDPPSVEG